MSVAAVNQKEYLKKYLSLGSDEKKKKKRKKKVISDRVQIVDDDIDLNNMQPLDGNDYNLYELAEDAPVIAGIVDERPDEVKALEVFSGSKWKIIQDVNGIEDIKVAEERTGKSHSDKNAHVRDIEIRPPVSGRRQRRNSSDCNEDSDVSPPRRGRSIADSDESPPRMPRGGRKSSGPQNYRTSDGTSSRKADLYSPKRPRHHSDERVRSSDSDMSPPRKSSSKSNSKQPPRRRTDRDSDPSPRRASKKREDSDESPPRKSSSKSFMRESAHKRSRFDKDPSPPRGSKYKQDSDESPPRKSSCRVNSDASHTKSSRKMDDSDESPARKSQKKSGSIDPPRKKSRFDRDPNELPPRKSRNADDSDESPPRKPKPTQRKSRFNEPDEMDHKQRIIHENFGRSREREKNDSHRRAVKGKRGYPSDSDESPPRHGGSKRRESPVKKTASRGSSEEGNNSKHDPRVGKKTDSKKMEKQERTLEGKKAGLQDSKAMRMENLEHQLREREMFSKMSDEVSGRDAAPIVRDRATGKKRDLAREAAEKEAAKEKEDKRKEKYSRWGKGLKQVEDQQSRLREDIYEMSKPLARYADDKDLERHLIEQEREGDPMQEYIRNQKLKFEKENPDAVVQKKTYPVYQGPAPPPNRFNIKPGYRWDGVDRSTGFEQKWFQEQNSRKALQEEAYKWSTEDM